MSDFLYFSTHSTLESNAKCPRISYINSNASAERSFTSRDLDVMQTSYAIMKDARASRRSKLQALRLAIAPRCDRYNAHEAVDVLVLRSFCTRVATEPNMLSRLSEELHGCSRAKRQLVCCPNTVPMMHKLQKSITAWTGSAELLPCEMWSTCGHEVHIDVYGSTRANSFAVGVPLGSDDDVTSLMLRLHSANGFALWHVCDLRAGDVFVVAC